MLRDGPLAPAIHASCAVPFLFQPVRIDGRRYLDGGVGDRHGLAATRPGERVLYHHLTSRSPWRRRDSPALLSPSARGASRRRNRRAPAIGPFKLHRGLEAMERAAAGMRAALDAAR